MALSLILVDPAPHLWYTSAMPRTARLVIPGMPHHVVLRARRGKALFFDDQDRRRQPGTGVKSGKLDKGNV